MMLPLHQSEVILVFLSLSSLISVQSLTIGYDRFHILFIWFFTSLNFIDVI